MRCDSGALVSARGEFFAAEMKEPETRGFFEESDQTAAGRFPGHFRPSCGFCSRAIKNRSRIAEDFFRCRRARAGSVLERFTAQRRN
jgi:hypothetical protein